MQACVIGGCRLSAAGAAQWWQFYCADDASADGWRSADDASADGWRSADDASADGWRRADDASADGWRRAALMMMISLFNVQLCL